MIATTPRPDPEPLRLQIRPYPKIGNRERLANLKAQRARSERAEQSGGVSIEGGGTPGAWIRVTFAEKPSREVLDALKAAGYRWGAGSWVGPEAALPEGVRA